MIPSLLITFREVVEAALIVATILGIVTKLGQKKEIRTVWLATSIAAFVCSLMLLAGSIGGGMIHAFFEDNVQTFIEGALLMASAVFITWAVFFLHKHFGKYKTKLLSSLQQNIEREEESGLFFLVFTAVLREGLEIILFLSTVYVSASPFSVLAGFALGAALAVALSVSVFTTTIKLPMVYAFRVSSALLIMFAAGTLSQGIAEFMEIGIIPTTHMVTIPLVPPPESIMGTLVHGIFGITNAMTVSQLLLYVTYSAIMTWWVFFRRTTRRVATTKED